MKYGLGYVVHLVICSFQCGLHDFAAFSLMKVEEQELDLREHLGEEKRISWIEVSTRKTGIRTIIQ